MNPPPPAIHIIGQLGPSGCPPHPSSLPLRRPSTYLARSWGLLGEAVSSSASWLESLTIQTPPHLPVPCPVPPPSELCKSRLAGGSRPYRPLAPRGGPVRGSSVSSLQTAYRLTAQQAPQRCHLCSHTVNGLRPQGAALSQNYQVAG